MKQHFSARFIFVLLALLFVMPVIAQKSKLKNDSIAVRDSIKEMMFQGALLSMDALQAKYSSENATDKAQKQQKAGESQNLFFQSRKYYRRALGFDKNYYPAWTSLGTTYLMEDLPKASIGYYRQALYLFPGYSPAWFNLGKAYDVLGKKDSAVYSFYQCIHFDSTSVKAYSELSRIIMATKKDSAEALHLLRTGAHYQPASEVPWSSMAVIYFSLNDSANAISSLENAARIYSGDIDRLQLLADYFKKHNDLKKAAYYDNLVAVEKKKQEVPDDPDAGK